MREFDRPVAVILTEREDKLVKDWYEDGDDFTLRLLVTLDDPKSNAVAIRPAALFPSMVKDGGTPPAESMRHMMQCLLEDDYRQSEGERAVSRELAGKLDKAAAWLEETT